MAGSGSRLFRQSKPKALPAESRSDALPIGDSSRSISKLYVHLMTDLTSLSTIPCLSDPFWRHARLNFTNESEETTIYDSSAQSTRMQSGEALLYAESAGNILTVITNSSMDNATLESIVCDAMATNTYTGLTIYPEGALTSLFAVPSCINSTATYLQDLSLTSVIVTSGMAPPSLINLTIVFSEIPRSAINWDLLFTTTLPALTRFHVENCPDLSLSTLPPSIPRRIKYFNVNSNQIYGSIPTTMLKDYTFSDSLTLSMSYNYLSGPIPSGLFSGFMNGATSLPNLDITLDSNMGLNGTLPENLFGAIASLVAEPVYLSNASFRFSATSCSFEGQIPANLFGSTPFTGPSLYNFEIILASSAFGGTLPAALFSGVNITASNSFRLALNQIAFEGELPATLIRSAPSFTVRTLIVQLGGTSLTGNFPQDLFKYVTVTDVFSFSLSNSDLSGPLPSSLNFNFPSGLSSFSFGLVSSSFSGTIPSGLFGAVIPHDTAPTITLPSGPITTPAASTSAQLNIIIALPSLKLTGSIPADLFSPLIASSYAPNVQVGFNCAGCRLSGTIPSSWNGLRFSTLLLDNNANLTGTIPSALLSSTFPGLTIGASSTNLTGIMPLINATRIALLQLDNTAIDFCSSPDSSVATRPTWAPAQLPAGCLLGTSACACQDKWPAICVRRCNRIPTVSGCPPSTYPGPGFYCNGTIWTSDFTVQLPTLTIPSGAVETVVNGDVASSTIVFNGLNSTLIIKGGCATNLSSITIELTQEEAKKIGKSGLLQKLISYYASAAACNATDTITLNAVVKDGGCRKVKAQVSNQDSSSLSAYFTMDSSKCNLWWIILVSVVAGLVVLVAIILALLSIFSPSFRNKVRPFSNRARPNNLE